MDVLGAGPEEDLPGFVGENGPVGKVRDVPDQATPQPQLITLWSGKSSANIIPSVIVEAQ